MASLPVFTDRRGLLVTLPSGMRVACVHTPGSRVDYFGLNVDAGARDEDPSRHGLAHFVEHTIFKGTARHRASYVNSRMEAVGGELNAYTGKEETVIYTIAPTGYLQRSVDLVAELVLESTFPDAELRKEREVVLDEIASYLDSPADAVTDDFEDLIFAGSGLGHNILGTAESVEALTSTDCLEWLESKYVAEAIVAFYVGPLEPDEAVRIISRRMEDFRRGTPASLSRKLLPEPQRFDLSRSISSHQAHSMAGARIPGILSPERSAYLLLANILGGPGMNSLLNVELRERRGLVYTVDAAATLFSDCGALEIYFGCDMEDTTRCLRRVQTLIGRVADGLITPVRLDKAKRQYIGQLAIGSEQQESRALSTGRSVQLHGTLPSLLSTVEAIKAVTPESLASAAAYLLPLSRLTLE